MHFVWYRYHFSLQPVSAIFRDTEICPVEYLYNLEPAFHSSPCAMFHWKDYCNLSWPPTVNIVFTVTTVPRPVYTPIGSSPNLQQFPRFSGVPHYLIHWKDKTTAILSWPSTVNIVSPTVPRLVYTPIRSLHNLQRYSLNSGVPLWLVQWNYYQNVRYNIHCHLVQLYSRFGTKKARILSQSPESTINGSTPGLRHNPLWTCATMFRPVKILLRSWASLQRYP